MSLETDISKYLRGVVNKQFPARFYRADTFTPYVSSNLTLIENYDAVHGALSTGDIVMAYVLSSKDKTSKIVSSIREFGVYLSSRYNIENNYKLYNNEQYEVDIVQWRAMILQEKNYEKLLLDKIDSVNERIAGYPNSIIARKEIIKSNLVFDISWVASAITSKDLPNRDFSIQPIVDGGRINQEDAIDIFSLLRVKQNVPYIAYHTPGGNQYKVSGIQGSAKPQNDEYTYKSIIESDLYQELQNSLGFISFIIDEKFAIIDLGRSSITFYSVKEGDVRDLLASVNDYLYFFKLFDERRLRISSTFLLLKHLIIYPILYADLLLNEQEYTYFKEEDTPQLMKGIKLFYISPIPIVISPDTGTFKKMQEFKITISNHLSVNNQLVKLIDGSTEQLKKGEYYTELDVTDVNNSTLLDFVGVLLMKLFGKYIKNTEPEFMEIFKPDFKDILSLDLARESYMKKDSHVRDIDYLHHKLPDLFVNNYSRLCQKYQLPDVKDVLTPEEEGSEEWLKFPPTGDTEFYFSCEHHRQDKPPYPYPGVRVSNLKNKKRYPFIPCCFKTNQIANSKTETAQVYAGNIEGKDKGEIGSSRWGSLEFPPQRGSRTVMSEDKILYRGRIGFVPQILEAVLKDILTNVDSSTENYEIYRYGLSEPTLVHAIFLAMDVEYQKLSTEDFSVRDEYIKKHIKLPHLDALKQEIDLPERADLTDANLWLTKYHYRILEELFNINIFVLYRTSQKEGIDEPSHYTFEIPNSRGGFHVRHRRIDRPYVLLYKHSKYEGDIRIETPVELIIYGKFDNDMTAVWGVACSSIFDLYEKSYNVISAGFSPLDVSPASYKIYRSLFSTDYLAKLKGFKPSSQILDEFGRCRAINFEGYNFSVVFYPTQPYNLPSGPLIKSDYKVAKKLFGEPSYVSNVEDGIFYILGSAGQYFFIPLRKISTELEDIQRVNFTPLSGEQKGTLKNTWSRAYAYLKILLFIFSWLFTLNSSLSPTEFMEEHVSIDKSKHAAIVSDIYDFSHLKRIIVLKKNDMKHAMDYLHAVVPTLFTEDNKLLLTSQKLYDGFLYFLKTVDKQTELQRKHLSMKWDISHLFSLRDETFNEGSLYFDNVSALRTWFQIPSISVGQDTTEIVKEAVKNDVSIIRWKHPYTKRIWLIPGKTFKIQDAVFLVLRWYREKIINMKDIPEEVSLLQQKDLQSVIKYVFTFDNKIEINEVTQYNDTGIQVEILLSVPNRYTPLFAL